MKDHLKEDFKKEFIHGVDLPGAITGIPEGWAIVRIKRRKSAHPPIQVRIIGYRKQMHGYGKTIAEAIRLACERARKFDLAKSRDAETAVVDQKEMDRRVEEANETRGRKEVP